MEENNRPSVPSYINSFFLVLALGASIMVLGSMRLKNVDIPPVLLMGVSIASFLFVIIDFLAVAKPKIPMRVLMALSIIANVLSVLLIVCLPYMPFVKAMSDEEWTRYSDSFALYAFGVTIMLIGMKGMIELISTIKRRDNQAMQLKEEVKKEEEKGV